MRALVLEAGELTLRQVPAPEQPPGDVLLSVTHAGICGTDLALLRGYAGFEGIPGHEFVARVADAGGSEFEEGQRVVCEINVSCGRCDSCLRGMRTHCLRRQVIGIRDRAGAFAEYLSAPFQNVHAVPDEVSDLQAAFVEPLAAALQIPEQVDILPGMRVLVVGAGRLGQLIARAVALHAVDLQVVVRHDAHEACLDEAGIASLTEDEAPVGQVDVAIDATGHPAGVQLALDALRPRGTLVVKSTLAEPLTLDPTRLVVDEISVVGSRCGSFGQALAALAAGQIDPTALVDAIVPLDDYTRAFERATAPGALKILMTPGAQSGVSAR